MNKGLFSALQGTKAWEELVQGVRETGVIATYDMAEGFRPYLAAGLYEALKKSII